jgi:hypothetical protein
MSAVFVISPSREKAERHAALEAPAGTWFDTRDEAEAWLSGQDADIRAAFSVWRVVRVATQDGWTWVASDAADREAA